jgi:hypothetical protein
MGQYLWALVCDRSLATITGGEAGADAVYSWWVEFSGSASDLWSVPQHEDGQYGSIGGEELPGGLYLDKFVYTPIYAGDVEVRFLEVSSSSGGILSVPDSIVIRQVPEPTTIAFLGLGGLFVLRRR